MRLAEGFLTHDSNGQQILVAAGAAAESFHGVVRSNRTAAFIVDCLRQETTEKKIAEAMLERYDASEEEITRDVSSILSKLREIGAIHEA